MTTARTESIATSSAARRRTALCWAGVVGYLAVLTVASVLPSAAADAPDRGWSALLSPTAQNVLHFPAYAVLAVLVLGAADRTWRIGWAAALWLALACVLYGAILELLQAAGIPGRYGDWTDVLWNTTGGAGGWTLWLIFRHKNA